MMGSLITRALIMVFGYSYPAYECYKTVEKNKLDIGQLRFWCQYWILVALLTVFEKFGDVLISWVPMYSEAKLAFFIYLWCPKTKGATYVYDSFLRPYLEKHEKDIDRNLLELRTRAADITALYWQKAVTYGQTRVFEILQYIAAQSAARPHQKQGAEIPQIPPTIEQQPQQPPLLRTCSSGTTELQPETTEEASPASEPTPAAPTQIPAADQPSEEVFIQNQQSEAAEKKPSETLLSLLNSEVYPTEPQETLMEETVAVTQARLRKRRSTESL